MGSELNVFMKEDLREFKQCGYSDRQIVFVIGIVEKDVRVYCVVFGVVLVYKRVDICVVEFEVNIFYLYLLYDDECEVMFSNRKKVLIFGGGLN